MKFLVIWIFVLLCADQLDGIHANKTNANTVLNYINSKRRLHGCPPLILSDDLSLNCTKHAEDIAKLGNVTHSKPIDNAYTENICTFGIETTDALFLCVAKWYDGAQYDMMDAQAEEFTAMIWQSSNFFGYGEAMLNSTEAVMVVRFVPGGNVPDQYSYNVPTVMENNELDSRRFVAHYYTDQHSVIFSTCSKKDKVKEEKRRRKKEKHREKKKFRKRKKWRRRRRRRNCAFHQAPRVMLTILTISYWLGVFLN